MLNVKDEISRLATLPLSELKTAFEALCGEPTRSNNRVYLTKRIVWSAQAAEQGGLSERARQRAAELGRDVDLRVRPTKEIHQGYADVMATRARRSAGIPPPGSTIKRVYRGRSVYVKVLDRGFSYAGDEYASLTAVAKAITGSEWNGRLFFGLSKRRAAS
ncbi:MAG: DUF2924 domain-containing protein [Phycisphaerales bacterium]